MLNKTSNFSTWFWISIGGLLAVYVAGLFVDIMDVDAAQYASIAREMLESGSFLQVKHRYHDYLDKPPLHFWLSAASFALFGFHNWAYKLPSLLFTILGVYSTYRFARLYYAERVACISALILASCQALILVNNDVRTDTLLLNAVIFSVWQLSAWLREQRWSYLLGSGLGIGLAMLAKGPIGLMVPVLAFGTDWLLKGECKNFWRPQWLILLLIVGIILTPMVMGLYRQFGTEGPYFYFWAQSFGRLTGDNPFIQGQAEPQQQAPFFFMHTFLWSFIPWSLLFLGGLWLGLKGLFVKKFRLNRDEEALTIGGFILPFIALSFSEYKLPHYIYVMFPFAAVITARFIHKLLEDADLAGWARGFTIIQAVIAVILWLTGGLMAFYIFPAPTIIVLLLTVILIGFGLSIKLRNRAIRLVFPSVIAMIGVNLYLNLTAYPALLAYQPTNEVGRRVVMENIDADHFYAYKAHAHSLDYYAQRIMPVYSNIKELQGKILADAWVYTNQEGLKDIRAVNPDYEIIDTFEQYKVTLLTAQFLSPATRASKTNKTYLVKW